MRLDLINAGFKEMKSAGEVDQEMNDAKGTALVVSTRFADVQPEQQGRELNLHWAAQEKSPGNCSPYSQG